MDSELIEAEKDSIKSVLERFRVSYTRGFIPDKDPLVMYLRCFIKIAINVSIGRLPGNSLISNTDLVYTRNIVLVCHYSAYYVLATCRSLASFHMKYIY